MKKLDIHKMVRSKGFFTAVIAIVVISAAIPMFNGTDKQTEQRNPVDLNTPLTQNEPGTGKTTVSPTATPTPTTAQQAEVTGKPADSVTENDPEPGWMGEDPDVMTFDPEQIGLIRPGVTDEQVEEPVSVGQTEPADTTESEAIEEASSPEVVSEMTPDPGYVGGDTEDVNTEELMPVNNDALSLLSFDISVGILAPVAGEVLLPYSMEHTVFHETLAQFRVNPAVLLQAGQGEPVLCVADGIVTSIVNSPQTGYTMTLALGDGYYVVYGQLEEPSCEVGTSFTRGEQIGVVAMPTRYYIAEGTHLYLQIRNEEGTLDPMSLID